MHRGGGNRRNRGHHHNRNKINLADKEKDALENIDENNPIIVQFRAYATELDDKYDRAERIVKLSRDITIMSKRIIFLLHTMDNLNKRETVLEAAKVKLDHVIMTLFKSIAEELQNEDPYQYLRAYRAGMEEFIEAITFYQYLQNQDIQDWTAIEKSLTYKVLNKCDTTAENIVSPMKVLQVHIPPDEFILGIADLTGELMRKCIKNLVIGDIDSCYQTCNFVRTMYKGFLSCSNLCRKEINKKRYTLKQSLMKMENVCYTIKVRGSEMPKHVLADVALVVTEECNTEHDEGYEPY